MTLAAYVDESEPRQDRDPGTYVLCAALVRADDEFASREVMRSTKRRSQSKVHWHDEVTDRGRMLLVETVASISAEHLVIVRIGDVQTPSERRRRLCLERLCFELEALQVQRIVMESRGPSDKLDRKLIDTMRAKKTISASLRIDHVPGPAEPLLWIPDVICGVMAQDRFGNPAFLDRMRRSVTTIDI